MDFVDVSEELGMAYDGKHSVGAFYQLASEDALLAQFIPAIAEIELGVASTVSRHGKVTELTLHGKNWACKVVIDSTFLYCAAVVVAGTRNAAVSGLESVSEMLRFKEDNPAGLEDLFLEKAYELANLA